mgnify:CR=1 FL=1
MQSSLILLLLHRFNEWKGCQNVLAKKTIEFYKYHRGKICSMHNAKSQLSQVFIEDCFISSMQLYLPCPYFHWAFDINFAIIVLFQVEMNVNGATANACQTLNGVQVCGEYNLSEDFYNTCSIPEGELVLWLLVGII